MRIQKFSLIILFSVMATFLAAQEITIGGFQDVAPYVIKIREEGKPDVITGGIIKEITDEVALRTGFSFTYFFPPRRRLELEIKQGNLHVLPMANPTWLTDPDIFDWTRPVFKERTVFMTQASFEGVISGLSKLDGLKVGMTEGYVYPEFPTNLNFSRENAATVGRNIKRLKVGWIDVMYGEEIDIQYHLKGNAELFVIHPWSISTSTYYWAVSKSLGENGKLIIATIETLIEDGTIDRILTKYR